jgi:hypothetical protein
VVNLTKAVVAATKEVVAATKVAVAAMPIKRDTSISPLSNTAEAIEEGTRLELASIVVAEVEDPEVVTSRLVGDLNTDIQQAAALEAQVVEVQGLSISPATLVNNASSKKPASFSTLGKSLSNRAEEEAEVWFTLITRSRLSSHPWAAATNWRMEFATL